MIRESKAYPVMLKALNWYDQSLTVRGIHALFAWMGRVFESSLVCRLSSQEVFAGSRISNFFTKDKPLRLGWLGDWYGGSRVLGMVFAIEDTVVTVMRNNRLFMFFLEDDNAYGE